METSGFGCCVTCRHLRRCFSALTVLNGAINALLKLEAAQELRFGGHVVLDTTQCYQPRRERKSGRA